MFQTPTSNHELSYDTTKIAIWVIAEKLKPYCHYLPHLFHLLHIHSTITIPFSLLYHIHLSYTHY